MIKFIEFSNYKALRNTKLELSAFTLLLGPNGSGKTSVLQALSGLALVAGLNAQENGLIGHNTWVPVWSVANRDQGQPVEIKIEVELDEGMFSVNFRWLRKGNAVEARRTVTTSAGDKADAAIASKILQWLSRLQTFSLDAVEIAAPAPITRPALLGSTGKNLAAVLDDLRDNHPDRWELLIAEMRAWLPEYDFIFFDTSNSQKAIALRTKKGGHRIPARELSQGTLVALALLTLAYLPEPPSLVGLEEIDRGLHPRLLRHLQDSLYRLSYPKSCGESRPAIQVIATTHSPYLLDLYRDHPEEIVISEKAGLDVQMRRLADVEHFDEILGESPLSDVWYSGILGGVAVKP